MTSTSTIARTAQPIRPAGETRDHRLLVASIERQLARVGVRAGIKRSHGRIHAHGMNLRLTPRDSIERCLDDLAALAWVVPGSASLHLADGTLGAFADYLLGNGLSATGGPGEHPSGKARPAGGPSAPAWPGRVGLGVDAGDGCDPDALRVLAEAKGFRPGFAFVDGGTGAGGRMPEPLSIWRRAFRAGVRSRCPLLAAEIADTVVDGLGVVAPANTAWLPLTIDVARFARPNGDVDGDALDAALDACIELGDRLIDRVDWLCPAQAEDARVNRRLAIRLAGIGDLVQARGDDPSSFALLRDLDSLVDGIHRGLWRRSRRLAERLGALPALTERQPSAQWRDESHRLDWARRWRQAVDNVQVRHRNLLLMSPWCLFPRRLSADVAYTDLLPLLAHADALGFAGAPDLGHWQAVDRRRICQRLRAQVDRLNATSFIAAGA